MASIITGNIPVRIGDPSLVFGGDGVAAVARATPALIIVNYTQTSVTEYYSGAFLYDGAGALVGGALTGYHQVMNGQSVVQATGLNLPATEITRLTLAGRSPALMTLALTGNDRIWGGAYSDWIDGGAGDDTIIGLDGSDIVYGAAGNDDLDGDSGDDRVYGEDGADWVRGGQGRDTLFGGAGNDPHVNGNLGDDYVYGGSGDDTVYGGQGADAVGGDDGDDLVYGDLGNDIVVGGRGADILSGGGGVDYFFFEPGDGVDAVIDLNIALGEKIALRKGTTFTITTVSGYFGPGAFAGYDSSAVIDIDNATDLIVVFGVTPYQLGSNWVIYF